MTFVADRPDLRPFRAAPSRRGIVPNGGLVCGLLCLGGRFGFGGVGAGVCNPVADECEEAVEAVGGQVAERDFRPRAGQVRLTVEPRDAVDVRNPGSRRSSSRSSRRRVLPALRPAYRQHRARVRHRRTIETVKNQHERGLLWSETERCGPTPSAAGDQVPRDVVAGSWYADRRPLLLEEAHSLAAGRTRVSKFWLSVVIDGTGRPGSRSSFKICCRRCAASRTCDRGSAAPKSPGRFPGIPPRRRSITLVHGRLASWPIVR
jgi:hypothetical protein